MVAIIVHGGAAIVTPKNLQPKLVQLRLAAKIGFMQLLLKQSNSETTALDAVQLAVKHMEDSPYFNAGYGSSLTSNGQVEMDAIISDGRSLNFGAVASVTDYPNPILIARKILDQSEHCLFTRDGAHQFAKEQGFKSLDSKDELISEFAKQRLDEYKTFKNAIDVDRILNQQENPQSSTTDHDTVGAVAIDWFGNVASATSTGGITGKLPGRIGDTPIIGSGSYADNQWGAVSTTGHGEAIMRVCLAREVLYRYEKLINSNCGNDTTGGDDNKNLKNPMQQAVDESLQLMQTRINGYGGIIAIGNGYNDLGIGFNTQSMPWAYCLADDNNCEEILQKLNDCKNLEFSELINLIKIKIHYGYNKMEHLIIIE